MYNSVEILNGKKENSDLFIKRTREHLHCQDLLSSPHFLKDKMYQIVHKSVHYRDSILNIGFVPKLAHRRLDPGGKVNTY